MNLRSQLTREWFLAHLSDPPRCGRSGVKQESGGGRLDEGQGLIFLCVDKTTKLQSFCEGCPARYSDST